METATKLRMTIAGALFAGTMALGAGQASAMPAIDHGLAAMRRVRKLSKFAGCAIPGAAAGGRSRSAPLLAATGSIARVPIGAATAGAIAAGGENLMTTRAEASASTSTNASGIAPCAASGVESSTMRRTLSRADRRSGERKRRTRPSFSSPGCADKCSSIRRNRAIRAGRAVSTAQWEARNTASWMSCVTKMIVLPLAAKCAASPNSSARASAHPAHRTVHPSGSVSDRE